MPTDNGPMFEEGRIVPSMYRENESAVLVRIVRMSKRGVLISPQSMEAQVRVDAMIAQGEAIIALSRLRYPEYYQ